MQKPLCVSPGQIGSRLLDRSQATLQDGQTYPAENQRQLHFHTEIVIHSILVEWREIRKSVPEAMLK